MSTATIKKLVKARYEVYTKKFAAAVSLSDKLIETDIFGAYLDGASEIIAVKSGADAAADAKVVEAARHFNATNVARLQSEDDLLAVFEE